MGKGNCRRSIRYTGNGPTDSEDTSGLDQYHRNHHISDWQKQLQKDMKDLEAKMNEEIRAQDVVIACKEWALGKWQQQLLRENELVISASMTCLKWQVKALYAQVDEDTLQWSQNNLRSIMNTRGQAAIEVDAAQASHMEAQNRYNLILMKYRGEAADQITAMVTDIEAETRLNWLNKIDLKSGTIEMEKQAQESMERTDAKIRAMQQDTERRIRDLDKYIKQLARGNPITNPPAGTTPPGGPPHQ